MDRAGIHLEVIQYNLATAFRPQPRVASRKMSTLVGRWTLADVAAWQTDRLQHSANRRPHRSKSKGHAAFTSTLRKRFRTACKILGRGLASLTIHHGRHTFISHALAGGRTLAEVRDAAGHGNMIITSGYLHVAVDDSGVGNLFGFATIGL